MKSLSKGNNSKKDTLSSSSNLRESTALPLASSLPIDTFEDNITDVPFEKNKFGWSKQIERDTSPPFKVDRVLSGRAEGNLAVPYSDYYKGQRGGLNGTAEEDFDYSEETFEQQKMLRKINRKAQTYQMPSLEKQKTDTLTKHVDPSTFDDKSNSDDDLNALLKVPSINLDI